MMDTLKCSACNIKKIKDGRRKKTLTFFRNHAEHLLNYFLAEG